MIYLIGSLRNPEVPKIANKLRNAGLEVFDDWYSAGPEADDKWRDYEKGRGRSYMEALAGAAAKNVFQFDKRNLERATSVILVLPAGKSGHLELGWSLGRGVRGYILLDSPERWDVMYQFADLVTENLEDIIVDICRKYTINTMATHQQAAFTWVGPASGETPIQSEAGEPERKLSDYIDNGLHIDTTRYVEI
jgi:hypothetical protein